MNSQSNSGDPFLGKWETEIASPMGKFPVSVEFTSQDGQLVGNAQQGEDTFTFHPSVDGDKLKWSMKITKPMSINLNFVVSVDGDNMKGEAKAGFFVSSKLTGHRVSV
ncbi:hypothetical protein SAMN04487866_1277 [Thermoactinomyces sp. DSM 45891]|uniref:hypothetical protein n=1 Tax=Thermoactinomyces sp. DSM 45891 TaxID=1761907 RepID=UPI00091F7762|nr:hypothetical protein [Thermoactinomyces sp. DSM 45891]SFX80144.1 hypothetical protein SAMN04487866_1277 [Thermoactinomyces sp. DSM 45891]